MLVDEKTKRLGHLEKKVWPLLRFVYIKNTSNLAARRTLILRKTKQSKTPSHWWLQNVVTGSGSRHFDFWQDRNVWEDEECPVSPLCCQSDMNDEADVQ